ncbi:hypothetical protein AVEN_102046-1 [Araneus ventricosus]|uniref:Uncharacterized protein n=1 Tax=Araneus ventricosus TaxID=182803 RepID=A0A4Y2S779_ARAVE|nr:hypothetical protein AVEN_102046-1 [Araneus ventricosus]
MRTSRSRIGTTGHCVLEYLVGGNAALDTSVSSAMNEPMATAWISLQRLHPLLRCKEKFSYHAQSSWKVLADVQKSSAHCDVLTNN